MTRVLAIAGSLRRDSHNAALLRAVAGLAPDGVEVEIWEGLREIPPFDEDDDRAGRAGAAGPLREAVAGADAVLFATPEYNASVPGTLKNAVDWLSRPFPGNALYGRPAAVVSASTGQFGGVWAQEELRKVLRTAGARVVKPGAAVPRAGEAFDGDGRVLDPHLAASLREVLDALVAEVAPAAAVR